MTHKRTTQTTTENFFFVHQFESADFIAHKAMQSAGGMKI
jgi:hypothetical protein